VIPRTPHITRTSVVKERHCSLQPSAVSDQPAER
jgi:hypothetical protein